LDESIASIRRTDWWWAKPKGETVQRRLWDEVNRFFAGREHLRVDFSDMLTDPAREIRRIADYIDLAPDDVRFAAALASIRGEGGRATDAPRAAKAP
jgi:hypothetical protein